MHADFDNFISNRKANMHADFNHVKTNRNAHVHAVFPFQTKSDGNKLVEHIGPRV